MRKRSLRLSRVLCRKLHLYSAPLDVGIALRFRQEQSPPLAPSVVVLCRILYTDFPEFTFQALRRIRRGKDFEVSLDDQGENVAVAVAVAVAVGGG